MNILDSNKQKVSLIFNIEATIRTNSITSQNLVISACLDIKFMITYSKFHKGFSVRIFSSSIKIYRWCIAVFKIEVFVNSPLQKRESTGASLLYWLDWKSKH